MQFLIVDLQDGRDLSFLEEVDDLTIFACFKKNLNFLELPSGVILVNDVDPIKMIFKYNLNEKNTMYMAKNDYSSKIWKFISDELSDDEILNEINTFCKTNTFDE